MAGSRCYSAGDYSNSDWTSEPEATFAIDAENDRKSAARKFHNAGYTLDMVWPNAVIESDNSTLQIVLILSQRTIQSRRSPSEVIIHALWLRLS